MLLTGVAASALDKEQKTYSVRISGGNNREAFPMKILLYVLVIEQRELERGSQSLQMHIECQPGCSQLGFCKNNGEDIRGLMDITVPQLLMPPELGESACILSF